MRFLNSKRRMSGQNMVEFGMCSVVVIFLTMGIVQYGIIVNTENTVKQIAREGARAAAVYARADPQCSNGCCNTTTLQKMQGKCNSSVLWPAISANVTVLPACLNSSSRTQYSAIQVTVSYNLQNKFFLPTGFPGMGAINTTYTTTATAMME